MRVYALLLAATLTLCACSSPYVYQREIDSFKSSVTAVSTAVSQGFDNVGQDQSAADLAQVVAHRKGVNLDPVCVNERTEPCRILIPGAKAGADLQQTLGAAKPATLKVVSGLKSYADGLAAVANAQDRKDFDAAASQLASSVGALGTAVGAVTPAGAGAGPALSALVTLGTWVLGQGLDQARYETLKSAVNAVGKPSKELDNQSAIQVVAAKGITPALTAVRSARITLLTRQLNARGDRINEDLSAVGAANVSMERYDTPLTDLVAIVATLNLNRAVDPAAVGKSLVDAHDDLLKAVNDPSRQFQSVVSSIADFAAKAAAVEKAFTQKPTPTSTSK